MPKHINNRARTNFGPSVFSPVSFIFLFIAGFVIYTLSLTRSINPPRIDTIFYVVLSCFSFIVGIYLAQITFTKNPSLQWSSASKKVGYDFFAWVIFYLLSFLYIFEHIVFALKFGKPPVFIENFEELRFSFAVNGYVHSLAIGARYALLFITALKLSRNDNRKTYKHVFICFIFTLLLDFMLGNRGTPIILIFSAVILYSFYKVIFGRIVLFSVLAAVLIGFGKTFREYSMYGSSSLISVSREWSGGEGYINASLYHLYMAFAYNYAMLDRYISSIKEFHFGYFTIIQPFYSILPGDQYGMIDLQRDELGVVFHGVLTSTFLSSPYIDFGYFGAFIIFIIGYFSQKLYLRARTTSNHIYTCLYSFHAVNMFLGIYTYIYGQFYILMYYVFLGVILPAVCSFGARRHGGHVFSASSRRVQ